MELDSVDPLAGAAWDQLISQHPAATIFHTSAWAKVLAKTYGHTPFYVHVSSQGASRGLVPVMEVRSWMTGCRGVCLPFTDFCEPLIFEGLDRGTLMARIIEHGSNRGWKHLEVRGSQLMQPRCNQGAQFYTHRIDLLESAEKLFDRFESSVRRAIRKAQKSSVQTEIASTERAMAAFYALHVRTRRRHGLPPQPFLFFRNILQHIIQRGLGFIVSATVASRCAAAAIFFRFGNSAIYKYGASDERLQAFRGNNLVMWAAIQRLVADGCRTLSLGRTSLTSASLRQFKLGWGGEEELVSYTTCDMLGSSSRVPRHTTTGYHNALFRRLPLTINRLAGALVYPHLD